MGLGRWMVVLGSGLVAALLPATAVPAYADGALTTTIPYSFDLPNPCTLEEVVASGTQQVVMHFTLNLDGSMHFHELETTTQVTGEGIPSGNPYNVNQTDPTAIDMNSGQQSALDIVDVLHVISQGPQPNWDVYEHLHVTVNANGAVTVLFDNPETRCTG